MSEVTHRFGTPDIIVNNAGYTHRNRPLMEVDEATFDRLFSVNVKSIYHMVQVAARRCATMAAGDPQCRLHRRYPPRPGLTFYNASKGR